MIFLTAESNSVAGSKSESKKHFLQTLTSCSFNMGTCNACETNKSRLSTITVDPDPSKKSCKRVRSLAIECIFTPTESDTNPSINSKPITSDRLPTDPESNTTSDWVQQILTSISADSDSDDDQFDDNQTVINKGEHDQSSTINFKPKPNLFRPNTTALWDMSDIEDLQDDMKQQLEAIVMDHTVHSQNTLSINHRSSSSSNLIRTLSHDWDSEDMDIVEAQMKKSLIHLQLEHKNSNHVHSPMDR